MLHSSNLLFFWSSSHPSVAFSAGDPSNSASADDFSDMVLLPANEDRKKETSFAGLNTGRGSKCQPSRLPLGRRDPFLFPSFPRSNLPPQSLEQE